MWTSGWRDSTWSDLDITWQILIIGGGITGAGIFRQACQAGLRTLLVDANDFAYGTSSRSSKLVHGGFRYLANGQFNVTFESVRERERLLREAPHLVEPLQFVIPVSSARGKLKYQLGVLIYDLMVPKWRHGTFNRREFEALCPLMGQSEKAAIHYMDAKVDDARLVIRTIREGVRFGGAALNYAAVEELLATKGGEVAGVALRDREPGANGRTREVQAEVVINATGPWSDMLRTSFGLPPRLRRTRGSHLLFPRQALPTDCSFTLRHPIDGRTIFTVPWENTTLIGTTDVDEPGADQTIDAEPGISAQEFDYLMAAVQHAFPAVEISPDDVLATFSGLRPMVNTGEEQPSKVSRAHLIMEENGLISIMGGKLTTYRLMAHQTLERAASRLQDPPALDPDLPLLSAAELAPIPHLSAQTQDRLLGRYGQEAQTMARAIRPEDSAPIAGTDTLWAEVLWAAREEGIVHLDDLLLRRVRLGLLLPNGANELLEQIRPIIQNALGWDEARWARERRRYLTRWRQHYSPSIVSAA
jgi:glycerol-3-phosphate dehydrogenase